MIRRDRGHVVDETPETDIEWVAQCAMRIAEDIRDIDPMEVRRQLANLCRRHPVKAAQVAMALAAWVDPSEPQHMRDARVDRAVRGWVRNVGTGRRSA